MVYVLEIVFVILYGCYKIDILLVVLLWYKVVGMCFIYGIYYKKYNLKVDIFIKLLYFF